jgi:hypothetical protein
MRATYYGRKAVPSALRQSTSQTPVFAAQPSLYAEWVVWVSLTINHAYARNMGALRTRNGYGMTFAPRALEL